MTEIKGVIHTGELWDWGPIRTPLSRILLKEPRYQHNEDLNKPNIRDGMPWLNKTYSRENFWCPCYERADERQRGSGAWRGLAPIQACIVYIFKATCFSLE